MANTHGANIVWSFIVAAELMIIAIVPGPAVLGIASGTKAILMDLRFLNPGILPPVEYLQPIVAERAYENQ